MFKYIITTIKYKNNLRIHKTKIKKAINTNNKGKMEIFKKRINGINN